MRNFKTELKNVECEPVVAEFLSEIYEAEERGYSDPDKVPTLTYYKNTLEEYYKRNGNGEESEEVDE